jgi:ribonucleoside-diphosphate reductase alpha chain
MVAKLTEIGEYIWNEKYRYKDHHGDPIDLSLESTFARVARAVASVEEEDVREEWEARFFNMMEDLEVLPGGRIYAGAGTNRAVTLMNCYVMGTISDSLRGIHEALTESALTMQTGAGIGMDFSTLRPRGALVSKLGTGASGPLPFMDEWNSMCETIMSAGTRRGAMMGTLRCDHPDIEAFIEAKRQGKGRLKNFNLSVLITDEFMGAVEKDLWWDLKFNGNVHKTLQARDLWNKIMRSTYEFADPGVIFIDRVNAANPLRSIELISCTNPCGEQLLPPYGVCCLGSINLARLVLHPFEPERQRFNWNRLEVLVSTLVRFLDNVLDVTHYPLPQQRLESQSKRRIGIGITGLADCLVMLGVKYSEAAAVEFTTRVTGDIRYIAELASEELGRQKGSFPLFDPSFYPSIAPARRNSHLMSIQPTGTISLFAGNVSSGIEPIFDLSLKRRILQKDDTWKEVEVTDYAWNLYEQYAHLRGIGSEVWETAANLTPNNHIDILTAAQANIDSSVSKTINCPESITFEEFVDIYSNAYGQGAKSCTTYRPNKITGSILSSDSMTTKEGDMSNVVELSKPLVRPAQLVGSTYRLKPPGHEHALFITINDAEINGMRRPYEVFINTKNLEFISWTTALTVMISAIFRKGGDVSFVGAELKAVFDPRGGYWEGKSYVPSIIAGIGQVIDTHLSSLGVVVPVAKSEGKECPACRANLIQREGCWSCENCTYSRCG